MKFHRYILILILWASILPAIAFAYGSSDKMREAIKNLNIELLDSAISEGADINDFNIDGNGRSPIESLSLDVLMHYYSSPFSMSDVRNFADLMLDRGLKISKFDKVLFSPISVGDLELVKLLVTNGANVNLEIDGFTPHQIAVKYDQADIAEYLVSVGAIETSRRDILQLQLTEAVSSNELDRVKELVKMGASANNPDPTGSTPLIQALRTGIYEKINYQIVNFLLDNGADPNLKGDAGFGEQLAGIPLHLMVFMSQAPMSETKLKNEDRRKEANKYSIKTFKLLLQKGAHVSAKDSLGLTPLHLAAKQNNVTAAKILIKNGAKIMPEDNSMKTPLDYAESGEIIKILKDNGAVEN